MSEFDELMRQKAVALKYNPEKNGAPMIVASGMGYLAEKITETAMDAGVPVYEDNSLATLLTQLKLGQEIPRELYQAIVEIYIYFLGYVPDQKEEGAAEGEGEADGTDGDIADDGAEDGGGLGGPAAARAANGGRNAGQGMADGGSSGPGGASGGAAQGAAGQAVSGPPSGGVQGAVRRGAAGTGSGGSATGRAGSAAGRAEAVAGRTAAGRTGARGAAGGPGAVNDMTLRGMPTGPSLRESGRR